MEGNPCPVERGKSPEGIWDGLKYNFSRVSSICLPQQTLSTAKTADPAALSGGGGSGCGQIHNKESPETHQGQVRQKLEIGVGVRDR